MPVWRCWIIVSTIASALAVCAVEIFGHSLLQMRVYLEFWSVDYNKTWHWLTCFLMLNIFFVCLCLLVIISFSCFVTTLWVHIYFAYSKSIYHILGRAPFDWLLFCLAHSCFACEFIIHVIWLLFKVEKLWVDFQFFSILVLTFCIPLQVYHWVWIRYVPQHLMVYCYNFQLWS